jgi:hypothetical protein
MSARVGSPYGTRDDPQKLQSGKQFHPGQDFPARIGTPLYTNKPLVVDQVSYQMGASGRGYGNQIVLRDPVTGQQYRMAHLDEKPNWKKGDTIPAGGTIGHIGNTGGSTGPHLHYEVLNNGKPADPALYKDSTPVTFSKDGKGTLWNTLDKAKPDPNYRRGNSESPGAASPPTASPGTPGSSSDPIADLLRRQEEEKQRRRQRSQEATGQDRRSNEPSRSNKRRQGQGLTTGSPWHQLHDGG